MTHKLTIEQLKFARDIGATHWDCESLQYRKDGLIYGMDAWIYSMPACTYHMCDDIIEIDFAPLDDYYDDKAVDIAATSVPDGYYHDDESGKLKPLKPVAESAHDMVNNPPHYQTDGIECIDAIRASLGLEGFVAYCRGNAIKYAWRAGKKDETAQDLKKAAWYLNRAADELIKNNERTAGVNE